MGNFIVSLPYALKLLLFSTSISICCPGASAKEVMSSRIVGGTASEIGQMPYLVQLRKNGEFFCGGTLVSPQHIVTAAHCVKGLKTNSLTVVGGATELSEMGVRRAVAKIVIPRTYRTTSLHMDVAVLKLTSAMSGKYISAIDLCNSNWKVGDLVEVSGWGLTNEKDKHIPNRVRTVKVSLISKSNCKRQYRNEATLSNTMFCASVPGTQDACAGDSGGPAVHQGQLCGIVSWGIGCARKQYPGVYTNVKTVKSFIQSAMQT